MSLGGWRFWLLTSLGGFGISLMMSYSQGIVPESWYPTLFFIGAAIALISVVLFVLFLATLFKRPKVAKPTIAAPDWPIRSLFFHIDPDVLEEEDVGPHWENVERDVLNRLSTGQLRAWGELADGGNRPLTPIPQEFWATATLTHFFYEEGERHEQLVHAQTAGPPPHVSYRNVRFNKAEALAIWPKRRPLDVADSSLKWTAIFTGSVLLLLFGAASSDLWQSWITSLGKDVVASRPWTDDLLDWSVSIETVPAFHFIPDKKIVVFQQFRLVNVSTKYNRVVDLEINVPPEGDAVPGMIFKTEFYRDSGYRQVLKEAGKDAASRGWAFLSSPIELLPGQLVEGQIDFILPDYAVEIAANRPEDFHLNAATVTAIDRISGERITLLFGESYNAITKEKGR
ncbi:MAG: hypothetical protein AB7S92_25120 [Parvibaculaceae bacterium]